MEPKLPVIVGKLGKEFKRLNNSYYIIQGGVLVVSPVLLYSDSLGHAYGSVVGMAKHLKGLEKEPSDIKELVLKAFDQGIDGSKKCIDEVLALVDPENSFGFVTLPYKDISAVKMPYFEESLSTDVLRDLYLSVEEIEKEGRLLPENHPKIQRFIELFETASDSREVGFQRLKEDAPSKKYNHDFDLSPRLIEELNLKLY